ncbi:MAG: hypothetical protein CUN49_07090 [Candidatus Thermofonsia Clade 1 bacterium]|jgi:hypothetical protein|uniref:Uncharacterized protein n=1 Tax=Candidatus Thermofonsia Clade 1 bacterium TaxID=2364210 RepID=A0A2M8PEZ1_9CHLR|nr:MAG: hypothetical protein CUN49_07090 [Candidatus Thermofonsia Clade 1 bacterium]RMF50211.1 MAG: hypothetical protein D6749_11085 [Chloroflexota bacterium]
MSVAKPIGEFSVTERAIISSVDLGQDELAFVMRLYGLTEVGGFAIPTDFDERRAAAAADSLMARGLAKLEDNSPVFIADLVRLVTAGVTFSVALGISHQPRGTPERFWCYHQPEQLVLHDRSASNVERFELIESNVALSARLTTLLNATTLGAPEGAAFFIPKAVLARAEQLRAQAGDRAAHDLLRTLGYPESFLLYVLDERHQIVVVCIRLHEQNGTFQAETQTIMLIRAAQGYWLLEEDLANANQLAAQPIDANNALRHLIDLLAL